MEFRVTHILSATGRQPDDSCSTHLTRAPSDLFFQNHDALTLLRRPFKQAATTGREEGIATKQHAVAVVGDVAASVPGHMDHLESEAVPVDLIAIFQPLTVVIRHRVKFGAIEPGVGKWASRSVTPPTWS